MNCFNPCFTRSTSATRILNLTQHEATPVSILVLLDRLLQLTKDIRQRVAENPVSILVLLDRLLQPNELTAYWFNPGLFVSILVLLDRLLQQKKCKE